MAENRDQERLTLLVRAGEIFHQSLDVSETLNNVARLAVETFADLCLFDLIDESADRLFVTASAHRDRAQEEAVAAVSTILYVEEFGVHPVVQVTRTGEPFFLPHVDDAVIARHAASRQHAQYMRRFDYGSKIVVPVVAQDNIFGALTFVRTRGHDEFDRSDLLFAIEIGRRAGQAVANAKQFHREQYVAETLQRAFLPRRFPSRADLSLTAHYRPGSTEADIGGDWYDAFENDSGEIIVVMGDVTGKGVEAARLMVLMRQAIRVAALDESQPYAVADICNRLLLREGSDRLASAFVGFLDRTGRSLRYVSAGHTPPLIRLPSGEVQALHSPSPPLGAFAASYFEEHVLECPERSMLVLYTDGMIELNRDALAGEQTLREVLGSSAVLHSTNPALFIERAIVQQAPRDDVAIMVLNFAVGGNSWQFEAADARAAYVSRDGYFRCLQTECAPTEAELSECGVILAELIGNAVRHAPGALSVSLEFREGEAILHVIDQGRGFDLDPALPADIWSESGRGLYLVSMLSHRVVVERIPGSGCHIAVTLPVSSRASVVIPAVSLLDRK